MKTYPTFCFLILIAYGPRSLAQCNATLFTETEDNGVKFILAFCDTSLVSNSNGVLNIGESTKNRYGDSTVTFHFFQKDDTLQLHKPRFVDQPRKLKEFCSQKLMAPFNQCRTTLLSTKNGNGVRFVLTCGDTSLVSGKDGVLTILEKTKSKYGNKIFEFSYFDELDLTVYRTPSLGTTKRTLKEFCRQKMDAIPRQ